MGFYRNDVVFKLKLMFQNDNAQPYINTSPRRMTIKLDMLSLEYIEHVQFIMLNLLQLNSEFNGFICN